MNSPLQHAAFIIPCFNEAERINIEEYSSSIERHKNVRIYFIDDGSTDATLVTLEKLRTAFPDQIVIIPLPKNCGKAEAVRAGILHVLEQEEEVTCFGFLDADLATSIDETLHLSVILKKQELDMVFGSRISMVGTTILRNAHRHIIGRVIATFISNILRLRVYDTQCGAKVFSKELASTIFKQPFLSKWLFDVEIFARVLCEKEKFEESKMLEVPLKNWIDKDGSKVKWSYIFKLFFDLNKIRKSYPVLQSRQALK